MNAAQNSQRWAINQRRQSRDAASRALRSVDDERREKIVELQRLAAMMERLPAMASTRVHVLEQIAQLQASFATS